MKYKIKYHQRYSIDNHLNWLNNGKPGGSKHLKKLLGDKLNSIYKLNLEKSGYADTLIVEIEK